MAIYEILPTENLKTADIRDTLNANGGNVSNVIYTFFTPSANINMWSKYKPVPLTEDFPDFASNWWKGNSGNCGISIPQYNSMDDIYNATVGTTNGWMYTLPTGGSYEPFRLGDFRGYDPNAKPPFKAFNFPEKASLNANITATFEYNPNTEYSSRLQISDFGGIENCHLGVMIWDTTLNKKVAWNTTSKTIKEGANNVTVKMSVSNTGSRYKAVPFICTATQFEGEYIQAAQYYTLPIIDKVSVSVVTGLDELTIWAEYEYAEGATIPRALRYKFRYGNWSNGSTSSNTLKLLNSSGGVAYSKTLPDFTVAYEREYNYPYDYNGNEWDTISTFNFDAASVNRVRIEINNSRVYKEASILLPQ